jgi:hypothetical protein
MCSKVISSGRLNWFGFHLWNPSVSGKKAVKFRKIVTSVAILKEQEGISRKLDKITYLIKTRGVRNG